MIIDDCNPIHCTNMMGTMMQAGKVTQRGINDNPVDLKLASDANSYQWILDTCQSQAVYEHSAADCMPRLDIRGIKRCTHLVNN